MKSRSHRMAHWRLISPTRRERERSTFEVSLTQVNGHWCRRVEVSSPSGPQMATQSTTGPYPSLWEEEEEEEEETSSWPPANWFEELRQRMGN